MILNFYRAIHSYGMILFLHRNPLGLHRSVEKNANIDLHSVGMQPKKALLTQNSL
ncbi:MAG: hypothetical protein LBN95_06960 [Prevotellaceae bacterium]|nr:hypothetical protein [Prevotellaceae bacterium]